MSEPAVYSVAIVVDPDFGNQLADLLARMPVWIANTEANRTALARMPKTPERSNPRPSHTDVGAWTTFTVDLEHSPESWCIDNLNTVAGHHDRYSHSPGYSALEVYGATPSPRLLSALGEYKLTEITPLLNGFRAATSDGREAGSPNDG